MLDALKQRRALLVKLRDDAVKVGEHSAALTWNAMAMRVSMEIEMQGADKLAAATRPTQALPSRKGDFIP